MLNNAIISHAERHSRPFPKIYRLSYHGRTCAYVQLADIQKPFGAMSQAIARLWKEHSQLCQQAVRFQTLHNCHESSLSAILTFVANVCNGSVDSKDPQNFAQMRPNSIPPDQQRQNQGNTVDTRDFGSQSPQNRCSSSPRRRQHGLLLVKAIYNTEQQMKRIYKCHLSRKAYPSL